MSILLLWQIDLLIYKGKHIIYLPPMADCFDILIWKQVKSTYFKIKISKEDYVALKNSRTFKFDYMLNYSNIKNNKGKWLVLNLHLFMLSHLLYNIHTKYNVLI